MKFVKSRARLIFYVLAILIAGILVNDILTPNEVLVSQRYGPRVGTTVEFEEAARIRFELPIPGFVAVKNYDNDSGVELGMSADFVIARYANFEQGDIVEFLYGTVYLVTYQDVRIIVDYTNASKIVFSFLVVSLALACSFLISVPWK